MITTAIYNRKGGVAKTTTTLNLAAALKAAGHKVLVVDLDPQMSLTASLLELPLPEDQITTAHLLTISAGKYKINQQTMARRAIIQTAEGVDIIPASKTLGAIAEENENTDQLKTILTPIADDYEVILIDCAPSNNNLAWSAISAADNLIVPLQAETLAWDGLRELLADLGLDENLTDEAEISNSVRVLITRWENTRLNKLIDEQLREAYGQRVFNTRIRRNTTIGEAPLMKQSVIAYNPTCNGSIDYKALAQEYIKTYLY